MDALPFADACFDVAVAFNAFQFARTRPSRSARPLASSEARRAASAATTFAEPERNESTALHLALEPLRDGAVGPGPAPSAPTACPSPAGSSACSAPPGSRRWSPVRCRWCGRTPTPSSRVRAVLASGGGAMAIEGRASTPRTDALRGGRRAVHRRPTAASRCTTCSATRSGTRGRLIRPVGDRGQPALKGQMVRRA